MASGWVGPRVSSCSVPSAVGAMVVVVVVVMRRVRCSGRSVGELGERVPEEVLSRQVSDGQLGGVSRPVVGVGLHKGGAGELLVQGVVVVVAGLVVQSGGKGQGGESPVVGGSFSSSCVAIFVFYYLEQVRIGRV